MSNNRQLKQNALTRTDGVMAAVATAAAKRKKQEGILLLFSSLEYICAACVSYIIPIGRF